MGKKLKRFLAMALAFIMFATCCEVPMTAKAADSIYAPYDVITYDDLLDTGDHKLTEGGVTLTSKQNLFHYDVTSTTHSVIFKMRWVAGTDQRFQAHPGTYGGSNNFAYRIYDGKWVQRNPEVKVDGYNVQKGDSFDVEIARLMVATGDNAGKYYTYFKVDGKLIFEKYVSASESNTSSYLADALQLNMDADGKEWRIEPSPEVAEDPNPDAPYYDYDEITYADLKKDGNSVSSEGTKINGGNVFTYNATSPTYSAILKFRWTAGSDTGIQFSFDKSGTNLMSYPFGVWVKKPNKDGAGANGAWHLKPTDGNLLVNMNTPASQGDVFDIEIGRLKVKNGDSAHIGQYYVYLKVNDVLVQETYSAVNADGTYKSGNTDCQLSNEIVFDDWGGYDNMISEIPVPETFEEYDEITFDDLYIGSTSMNGQEIDGSQNYTYNAKASSYSMKLKFRWIAGETSKFTLFLDSSSQYPFCYAVKTPNQSDFGAAAGANGAWHLVPSNASLIKQMDTPIVVGQAYDIELGRLKVKTGANTGKYYVYWKVNDELIQSYYYGGVADGTYGKEVSNIIKISAPSGNKFSAIPVPETFEEYDEITYDDLYIGSTSMNGMEMDGGNRTYTYNATSSSYSMKLKFRWTAGETARFTAYLDDWVFPFCFAAKEPNRSDFGAAAGANGAWHLEPSKNNTIVQMSKPIAVGETHDIEIGRLKVKTGRNTGKYYVYWMVDGQLVQSYYYDGVNENGTYGGGTALSNKIIIASLDGNKFSAIPVPETYEEFDEISFNDLYEGNTSMFGKEMDGSHNYTYNATSSTYSTKFKFRWTAGDKPRFTVYFDEWKYPFCFAAKEPNQSDFGAAAGANGAWHLVPSDSSLIVQMDKPIVTGKTYDIEVGRLKVKTGRNAGKYYVYFMVNDQLIQSYYYNGVVNGVYDGVALSNKIIFSSPSGNKFSDYPFVEEYEAYDEIGYKNLTEENGDPLGSQRAMSGGTVLKYNRTSPTGSTILKFRWKVGSVPKFQLSFEKTASNAMAYMFGAWLSAPGEEANYPNGRMWLRPGYGPQVNLSETLKAGNSYNVEFARLKVKNGPNAGKYYVYIKLDGVLIAEDYVAADVVDSNGNYTSNPGSTACTISNEIFLAFWNSEGNIISPYRALGADEHEGIVGDFDNDGSISLADIVLLRKILVGSVNLADLPEGIADFNNDDAVDSRDLVSIKKFVTSGANNYEKADSLTFGLQEHLLEDNTKTATYIADVTATMGASAYRLSRPIQSLYYVTSSNGVAVKEENMAAFREMVNALKAKGIKEILYVTDSFLLPWNYADPAVNHNETVPNPTTEPENYLAWLAVNAAAFKALAEAFPEIKFFEPYNEVNLPDNVIEKPGVSWDETDANKLAKVKYTVEEKAAIMADLCWYITKAVKSVDNRNQVTSPSITVGTNSIIQQDFIEAFYSAIESGDYPTGNVAADTKIDNYFTIVNVHAYADYAAPKQNFWDTDKKDANINTWVNKLKETYEVVKTHNDGNSRVWLTETGMSTYHPDGNKRDESRVAIMIEESLNRLNQELTFIDTVIFYEVADMSWVNHPSRNTETNFGLFYAGDDSSNAFKAKEVAKKIYSFFHNGSTDYSALEALANRYK